MKPLTAEERQALDEIYSYKDEIPPIDERVIDSLVRRGLLARTDEKQLQFTELGDQLYEKLHPDEPYEGV